MQRLISLDDRTLLIQITEEDQITPKDLTGITVELRLKTPDGSVISKTEGSGLTIQPQTGATIGQAIAAIDSVDTAGVDFPETWAVEVKLTRGGKRATPIQDSIRVLPETT